MTKNTTPNPTVIPKKRIKSLKELRGYGLGERNPDTAPELHAKSETKSDAQHSDAKWSRLRKQVEAGRLIGAKY